MKYIKIIVFLSMTIAYNDQINGSSLRNHSSNQSDMDPFFRRASAKCQENALLNPSELQALPSIFHSVLRIPYEALRSDLHAMGICHKTTLFENVRGIIPAIPFFLAAHDMQSGNLTPGPLAFRIRALLGVSKADLKKVFQADAAAELEKAVAAYDPTTHKPRPAPKNCTIS